MQKEYDEKNLKWKKNLLKKLTHCYLGSSYFSISGKLDWRNFLSSPSDSTMELSIASIAFLETRIPEKEFVETEREENRRE